MIHLVCFLAIGWLVYYLLALLQRTALLKSIFNPRSDFLLVAAYSKFAGVVSQVKGISYTAENTEWPNAPKKIHLPSLRKILLNGEILGLVLQHDQLQCVLAGSVEHREELLEELKKGLGIDRNIVLTHKTD